MKATPLLLCALACVAAPLSSQAATGIFGSFAFVDTNQNATLTGPGDFFGAQDPGSIILTAFQNADLGDFNAGTSVIIAGEVLTYKNNNAPNPPNDVTGAFMHWRVYTEGSPTGSFNQINLGFTADASFNAADGETYGGTGDQKWANAGSTPNILAGLLGGAYNLEVYFRTTTNGGDQFSNNGGSNYIARFDVVPEPSRALLVAFGLLGMISRRRR